MTQPYKLCPACGQPAVLTMPHCGRCGHAYRTQHVPLDQTQAVYPQSPTPPPMPFAPWQSAQDTPNYFVISLMWLLTVVSGLIAFYVSFLLGIIVDAIAICCAICLVMSKVETDKNNGKAKLGLEAFAFLLGVMSVFLSGSR